MRIHALLNCPRLLLMVLFSMIAIPLHADEISEIKAELAERGLTTQLTTLIVPGEAEFVKKLNDLTTPRRQLTVAVKDLQTLEKQGAEGKNQLTALKQKHVQLSAQLTQVAGDVTLNNQVVGALNAVQGQMELISQQLEQHEEKIRKARGVANDAREKYVEYLLSLRKQADKISGDYEKQNNDKLPVLLERMKTVAGKSYSIGPTPSYKIALKKLQGLEDTVLSESIALRAEGKTLFASVVVNGKHTQEMVVDSGASIISLPFAMAAKFGLTPSSTDQKIVVGLADGSRINAWKMKLSSVRVGKFTVENVECAVLGPEAVAAEPLLGMSFLGEFQFEINAAKQSLTMVKIANEK